MWIREWCINGFVGYTCLITGDIKVRDCKGDLRYISGIRRDIRFMMIRNDRRLLDPLKSHDIKQNPP